MDPLVRGLGVCSGPGVGGGGVQDLFGYHCARLAGSVMGVHAVSVPHSHHTCLLGTCFSKCTRSSSKPCSATARTVLEW